MTSRPVRSRTSRLILCFSLATLLFARQAAIWTVPFNRMLYHWQRTDALWISAGIIITAALGYGLATLIVRHGRIAQMAGKVLTVFLLADIAVAMFGAAYIADIWWVDWMVPVAALATVATALLLNAEKTFAVARATLMILSPLGVVLIVQLFLWPTLDARRYIAASRPDAPDSLAGPVIILMFDDWSLARSVNEEGDFLPDLGNLRALADSATVFAHAESPGAETILSIPGFLFQRDGELVTHGGSPLWVVDGSETRASQAPSMLSRAAEAGYLVRVFGFYLPYRAIVGDAAVEVHAEPNWPKRSTIAGSVGWSMVRNLEFMGNPLVRIAGRAIFGFSYDRYWYDFNRRLEDSVRARIHAGTSREFVFAHIGLPHAPFVFAADGSFQGDSVEGRMEASPSKYAVHLKYVDGLIGRVLDDLRASGLYDQSLIVITADHNWKVEPDGRLRRGSNWALSVPLVVKFPGQRQSMRVQERMCLLGFEPFLQRVRWRTAQTPASAEVDRLTRESCDRAQPRSAWAPEDADRSLGTLKP